MEQITLEQINKNILLLKREVDRIKEILEESYLELEDDVVEEVEESRKKPKEEFVSHEEVREEFG